jgi:hypothetical protein
MDEHMERGNEHMERGNELIERGNELMDEVRAEVQLTREVVRRHEIAFMDHSRLNAELVDAVREVKVDLRQLGSEVRAQTEAIFRMIDRFDGGTEPAT